MSIVRYRGREKRYVVVNAMGPSPAEALRNLGDKFQGMLDANAINPEAWPDDE